MEAPIIKEGMIPILSPEENAEYYDVKQSKFTLTEQFESNNFSSGSKFTHHYVWHQETQQEGIALKWEEDYFGDENAYKDGYDEFIIYYRVIR